MVDVLEAIDCSDRLVSALLISYANIYQFEQELKDELFGIDSDEAAAYLFAPHKMTLSATTE